MYESDRMSMSSQSWGYSRTPLELLHSTADEGRLDSQEAALPSCCSMGFTDVFVCIGYRTFMQRAYQYLILAVVLEHCVSSILRIASSLLWHPNF